LTWLRGKRANAAIFAAAAICTVVGSPVAWQHHYGILLPIYLVALSAALTSPVSRVAMLSTLLLSWTLTADFIPFILLLVHTPFKIVQAHCFFGALLLLFVLLKTQQPQNESLANSTAALDVGRNNTAGQDRFTTPTTAPS
jgi:alpha-1,2-mannosyltransferase